MIIPYGIIPKDGFITLAIIVSVTGNLSLSRTCVGYIHTPLSVSNERIIIRF